MPALRLLLAATFLVSLPFGLCDGPDTGSNSDQTKALKLALVANGDDANSLPVLGTTYDCGVTLAHPVAPRTPGAQMPARCIWTMEDQGGVWLATFRETWLCAIFSVHVAGYTDCQPPTGFHEWQYQVDLSGPVQQISSRGAFAPDMQ